MRVVNFPPRGIGARSIEQLQDVSRASGCSLHDGVSAVASSLGETASLGAQVTGEIPEPDPIALLSCALRGGGAAAAKRPPIFSLESAWPGPLARQ